MYDGDNDRKKTSPKHAHAKLTLFLVFAYMCACFCVGKSCLLQAVTCLMLMPKQHTNIVRVCLCVGE